MAKETSSNQPQSVEDAKKKNPKSDQAYLTKVIKQNDLLVRKGGCPPPVPPRDTWVDDTISEDTFWDKAKKPKLDVTPQSADKLWFIKPEPRADSREEIEGNSILRFRNEQKELLLSTTTFPAFKELSPEWNGCVDYITTNPGYANLLKQAKVFNAVVASTQLRRINTSRVKVWRALLSRWSTQTHTLITAWGEITPTLEDVVMLLNLWDSGQTDVAKATTSHKEHSFQTSLVAALKLAQTDKRKVEQTDKKKARRSGRKKPGFSPWLKHFFEEEQEGTLRVPGPGRGKEYELAAFIAYWLSLFVFPGGPEDSVSPRLFPLAIRVAQGQCFALASFYLGSLYRRLDLYHVASVHSMGRYVNVSHVDLAFLQLFFCERFRKHFGPPAISKDPGLLPRAWAWEEVELKWPLLQLIDIEGEFTFRPYTKQLKGYENNMGLYPSGSEGEVTLVGNRANLGDPEARFLLWCIPGSLPSLLDNKDLEGCFLEKRIMVYSPHRVARQFGFDQGMPRLLRVRESFESCCRTISPKDFKDIHPTKRQLFFPSMDRYGKASPGWLTYWANCLVAFREYTFGSVGDALQAHVGYRHEFYLKLPNNKSNKSNGDGQQAAMPPSCKSGLLIDANSMKLSSKSRSDHPPPQLVDIRPAKRVLIQEVDESSSRETTATLSPQPHGSVPATPEVTTVEEDYGPDKTDYEPSLVLITHEKCEAGEITPELDIAMVAGDEASRYADALLHVGTYGGELNTVAVNTQPPPGDQIALDDSRPPSVALTDMAPSGTPLVAQTDTALDDSHPPPVDSVSPQDKMATQEINATVEEMAGRRNRQSQRLECTSDRLGSSSNTRASISQFLSKWSLFLRLNIYRHLEWMTSVGSSQ